MKHLAAKGSCSSELLTHEWKSLCEEFNVGNVSYELSSNWTKQSLSNMSYQCVAWQRAKYDDNQNFESVLIKTCRLK